MIKTNFKRKRYNKSWKWCNSCKAIIQTVNYSKDNFSKPKISCSVCRSRNIENITKEHKQLTKVNK